MAFQFHHVLREYERGVIFRGRLLPEAKARLIFVGWFIDKLSRCAPAVTLDVPPQDIITRDNVSVKVNAVVYFRVMNAIKAIVDVENYLYATSQLAQTTLRSILGEVALDDLLSKRETLNTKLQTILDQHTDAWGIKVALVEVKQVDLPQEMQRRWPSRPKPNARNGPKSFTPKASTKRLESWPKRCRDRERARAIQLRYLQTLTEIGVEKNTTVIFPIPVDVLQAFLKK